MPYSPTYPFHSQSYSPLLHRESGISISFSMGVFQWWTTKIPTKFPIEECKYILIKEEEDITKIARIQDTTLSIINKNRKMQKQSKGITLQTIYSHDTEAG